MVFDQNSDSKSNFAKNKTDGPQLYWGDYLGSQSKVMKAAHGYAGLYVFWNLKFWKFVFIILTCFSLFVVVLTPILLNFQFFFHFMMIIILSNKICAGCAKVSWIRCGKPICPKRSSSISWKSVQEKKSKMEISATSPDAVSTKVIPPSCFFVWSSKKSSPEIPKIRIRYCGEQEAIFGCQSGACH